MNTYAKIAFACAMLATAIAGFNTSAFAGSTRPGAFQPFWLASGDREVLSDVFLGGREAIISIESRGCSVVDFTLRDENDNVIKQGKIRTDHKQVTFQPAWTGEFTLELENLGSCDNRMRVRTN